MSTYAPPTRAERVELNRPSDCDEAAIYVPKCTDPREQGYLRHVLRYPVPTGTGLTWVRSEKRCICGEITPWFITLDEPVRVKATGQNNLVAARLCGWCEIESYRTHEFLEHELNLWLPDASAVNVTIDDVLR